MREQQARVRHALITTPYELPSVIPFSFPSSPGCETDKLCDWNRYKPVFQVTFTAKIDFPFDNWDTIKSQYIADMQKKLNSSLITVTAWAGQSPLLLQSKHLHAL